MVDRHHSESMPGPDLAGAQLQYPATRPVVHDDVSLQGSRADRVPGRIRRQRDRLLAELGELRGALHQAGRVEWAVRARRLLDAAQIGGPRCTRSGTRRVGQSAPSRAAQRLRRSRDGPAASPGRLVSTGASRLNNTRAAPKAALATSRFRATRPGLTGASPWGTRRGRRAGGESQDCVSRHDCTERLPDSGLRLSMSGCGRPIRGPRRRVLRSPGRAGGWGSTSGWRCR